MAYVFQTFVVNQVFTSAQANQIEANIRDHIHGSGGVTDNFYTMTVTGSASINGLRVNSGGHVASGVVPHGRMLAVGSAYYSGSIGLFVGGTTTVLSGAIVNSASIGDLIFVRPQILYSRAAAGALAPAHFQIIPSGAVPSAGNVGLYSGFSVMGSAAGEINFLRDTFRFVVVSAGNVAFRILFLFPSPGPVTSCYYISTSWQHELLAGT